MLWALAVPRMTTSHSGSLRIMLVLGSCIVTLTGIWKRAWPWFSLRMSGTSLRAILPTPTGASCARFTTRRIQTLALRTDQRPDSARRSSLNTDMVFFFQIYLNVLFILLFSFEDLYDHVAPCSTQSFHLSFKSTWTFNSLLLFSFEDHLARCSTQWTCLSLSIIREQFIHYFVLIRRSHSLAFYCFSGWIGNVEQYGNKKFRGFIAI